MNTVEATEKETPTVAPPTRNMYAVAQKLMGPVVEAVDKFLDPPERSQAHSEVFAFIQRLGEVLTAGRQKRIERLSAEQIRLAEECREQAAVYAESDKAVTAYLETKRARDAERMNARSQLSSWDAQRDGLGRWPTGAALREYEVKRAELVRKADAAQLAWEACFSEERDLIAVRTAEENKLKSLAQQESVLVQKLSGKTWTDPNLGLPCEPEL